MARTIQEVYEERNALIVAFAVMALRCGFRGGLTHPPGKTVVIVEIDPSTKKQVSWFLFGEAQHQAEAVLPETNLDWDGTYLGMDPVWPDLINRLVAQEAEISIIKDGDKYCAFRKGFKSLAESLAGFGDTPILALGELLIKENSLRNAPAEEEEGFGEPGDPETP